MPGGLKTRFLETPEPREPKPPVAPPAPSLPKPPKQEELRAFGDADKLRQFVYDDVQKAASGIQPFSDGKRTIRLTNVRYTDPERVGKHARKKAVLSGETIGRRLRGTWEMVDDETGNVLEKRDQVVARVPYFDSMGTITHKGNIYTINNQQRLRAGVFTRQKANGEIEAHANIMPGKGTSHRYLLDPEKGVFKIQVQQSQVPVMPLLKALGATDRDLQDAWGPDLYYTNAKANDAGALKKLKDRLFAWKDRTDEDASNWPAKFRETFGRMELEPQISQRTLGHPFAKLDKDSILATTKRILAVSRGEAEVDDRDHPAYQYFVGPEDLMRERIERDHGRHQRRTFKQVLGAGTLAKMPSGLFTSQIEQSILGSGLGQTPEEINPLEIFDKQTRITRMGEGGLPSLDAIPAETREVQASHMGFIDPVRTPESFRAGVDLNMTRGAYKGRDGQVYAQFRNARTGQLEWKSPRDLADIPVAFPGWDRSPNKRVFAIKGSHLVPVNKSDVAYVLPHGEDMFSPLANMIPMKSMIKGQRLSMGARMLTQALPLVGAEAPLVRGAVPGGGGKSFVEEYGKYAGAVRANNGGVVEDFKNGVLHVRYDNGKRDAIELYQNHPFARKTFAHQDPVVQPGQRFDKDQLLARSNYTDDKGAAALGLNARVAYWAWKGHNYEDAIVISESMAKRMTSEHAYQHDLELTDKHTLGKKHYISLFPAKYNRAQLDKLDDRGTVKPGQMIEFGDPLILSSRERDRPMTRVHKQRQSGYDDDTVTWKHHDPGVVTDVVFGKKGPTVVVKSHSSMQVGDKASGLYGDKGVVAKIVPDDDMPQGEDGRPFEILVNPLGVISRGNPAQMAEGWLGKIAEKTGKPYVVEDFSDVPDMMEHVRGELEKHGLRSTESILDPTTGRTIPNIATGNRFFLKLHHMAESKTQGRGSGGYTAEETPSKGGETGCFAGDVLIATALTSKEINAIPVPIRQIFHLDIWRYVRSRDVESGTVAFQRVTHRFHYFVLPEELIEVTLENGESFAVTRNHEMLRVDGTKVLAGDLQPGDDLME